MIPTHQVTRQIGLSLSRFGDIKIETNPEYPPNEVIGLLFSLDGTIVMPCGESFSLTRVPELSGQDLPCPCGDPSHWLVRFYTR